MHCLDIHSPIECEYFDCGLGFSVLNELLGDLMEQRLGQVQ